jgi:dihydroorotate dehydrogenase
MWKLLRLFFFLFDAERAHYLAMNLLSIALRIPLVSYLLRKSFQFENQILQTEICGLKAKNPLGLAAGFDKDGRWLDIMPVLGFGHVEVGTVTPVAQEGNPKPRLFRLKKDHSIINRMGFNNMGADALKQRLIKFKKPEGFIVGGNIGKNKNTANENSESDYLYCFQCLADYVDYFAVNVSSPNTPGLRALQSKEPLSRLLNVLQQENKKRNQPRPMFLKIAPDLGEQDLNDVVSVVMDAGFDGIIVCNTTLARPTELIEKKLAEQSGGLSGALLTSKAESVLQYLKKQDNGKLLFIGAGGIMTPEDAKHRMDSGANWIQIYSGFIYEGPWLIKQIKKKLVLSSKI